MPHLASKPQPKPRQAPVRWRRYWSQLSRWIKLPVYIALVLTIFLSGMYGIAEWYIHKHQNEPLQLGTTFIASYAESYGLDPHQTLTAIFKDLGIRHIRLVSYWDEIEPTPGHYNFSELDWEMQLAQQYGAKVTLSIGLRQPRWPECHAPSWVQPQAESTWLPQLKAAMATTINRYRNDPQLDSYQLENEYFLGAFGQCQAYSASRTRLVDEYNYVKSLDNKHPIILSLANNYSFPVGQPVPDYYGVSVYKRVFDYTITHRYFEYPFPPWYYAARAGIMEIFHGKSSVLHELQAEPWGPVGVQQMSLAEQDKTMNATMLAQRIQYAKDTGMRTIDLWGAEWWYWRKEKMNDPSLWNTVQQAVQTANRDNQKLK